MGAGKIPAIVVLLLSFSILPGSVQAKYSGGSGAPDDPYLISTAEDMNQIGRNYTDWDKCFKQTADINLSAYTGTQFSRIGPDDKHAFSGVFDGNSHTISGFTYTAQNSDYIGVFGNNRGIIENVSLVDVNITGRNYVGGLVGYLEGYEDGEVSNCYSAGVIRGGNNSRYIGGLVGCAGGYIHHCYSTCTVTSGDYSYYLGGLVGCAGFPGVDDSWGDISNCYSTGAVAGGYNSDSLGGLAGYVYCGDIADCYSTCTVTGGDYSYNLGGLVGCIGSTGDDESWGDIDNCFSTGAVTAGYDSDSLGGLAGCVYSGDIMDCYATGEVAGDYDVGGLVGFKESYSTITRCYSSGSVSGYMYVGGLVGWDNGEQETTDSFWDTDTSGQSWSDGGTGKTTVEMKTKSTFTDAGWDFSFIWDIVEGQTYPFFRSGGGTGTPDDPYRIATKADLLAMAANASYYYQCFILTADIDMEGQVFTTAIIAAGDFTGTFDGNDHKITNFTINGGDYLGLFGRIGYNGSVKNLGLEDFAVSGSYYVGGLVGQSGGSISNCYSIGVASGTYYIGGLVGYSYGTISNCFSAGDVTGGDDSYELGGLAGYNGGSISNCYSTGAASGNCYIGGLVGNNSGGTISNCYSTGSVIGYQDVGGLVGYEYYGNVSNCYSTGAVTVGYDSGRLGGLVGETDHGSISDCYSTGAVTGGDDSDLLGGLVGHNTGTISDCYSTGNVTGGYESGFLGGLVGYNSGGTVSNCYSTGAVTDGSKWASGASGLGGLVGCNSGSISNCYSTGSVSGSQYVGGLVGENYGTIGNCYSTGAVTGGYDSGFLGGLVGENGGTISNCNSTGVVGGHDNVGGLVGYNTENGDISDCYSTGTVTVTGGDCSSYLGGLVGKNYGTIGNCYSTGVISTDIDSSYVGGLAGYNEGTIISCYFLITSGPNDGNGVPLTDTQMKQQSSFVDWDFNDVWSICEGMNYPRLLWSIPAADLVCPDGVNFADYGFFANWWGRDDCALNDDCDGADFDFSGTVDEADLAIICNYWLEGL
jgi:hypothetical protein